jgi:FMN hydrolase / 5-amino-6-(5-phospho-D-ribitylamino)uracil phosphatase
LISRITALTLDLDDTLWPGKPAIAAAEAQLHAWLEQHAPGVAAALPPAHFAEFRRTVAVELPHLAHDFTALRHEALTRALALHGGNTALADEAMEVFLAARSAVELYADVPAALERLSGRFRLVALTNGNADIGRAGVARFFTCVVDARGAGVAKPDCRIFHTACARIEGEHGEVLHAGDDPDYDVRGARRAGLQAAWINRSGAPWPGEPEDYAEFRDLTSLCDWLGA